MIVRELVRRCDYDPLNIQRVRNLLDHSNGTSVMKEALSEDDNMVITLWDHYNRTGYLSARILDHIDFDNIGYVDASAIEALLESLPKKPFKVLSIHDCFRCLPSYGDDLRRQYNLQLHLVAKSNLLSDLISQIIHAPVQINKGDHTLADDILLSNYALS